MSSFGLHKLPAHLMQTYKVLNISPTNALLQNTLSKELNISKVLSQLLINRGIKNAKDAENFLGAKLNCLLDPYNFCDMNNAVGIIKKAVKNKEKVMIFGDYDVDGITSIAILKNTLSRLGLNVTHYLPHRVKEGYGLNKNILHIAKQKNIKLLITVDCGTNSHEEIKELKRQNIEVIVTDHHEPINFHSSGAACIINPKLKNSGYLYRDLAGVGVAYKLCQAITNDTLFEELDLVSLGTIADVAPLTGENRIFVKEGLKKLSATKRAGLKALIEISGIEDKQMTSTFVSYILGPRLNASGRLDSAETALNLLLTNKKEEAHDLAKTIDAQNRQRQKIEGKILEEAQGLIDKEINFKDHKIIVIAKEDWHPGVLGIVASKITEKFYRPTLVISIIGDSCKGSGRSIKNFHLFDALSECRELLETFGGHAHAAGFVITKDNIEDFKQNMHRLAREKLRLEDLLPTLDIDMEITLSSLNEEIIRELEILEPYGAGNHEPLFYTRALKLKGTPQLLGRNTLKFWVSDGIITYQAIAFGMGNLKDSLCKADYFDLVYNPQIDNWQDKGIMLLEVKDIFFR